MNNEQSIRSLLQEWIFEIISNFRLHRIRRIDTRRIWPLSVILLIVLVTITHEAKYAGDFEVIGLQFIGWFYAIAINMAIIVSEYFTQWKSTRKPAWIVFGIATVGSGALNIAYVKPWNNSGFDAVFAWIYSLLPTILIVFLGFLSSNVAKIARTQEARWERESTDDQTAEYECFCGEKFHKPIQLANHTKKHIAELKQNSHIESGVSALVYFKENYPDAGNYPVMDKLNKWVNSARGKNE